MKDPGSERVRPGPDIPEGKHAARGARASRHLQEADIVQREGRFDEALRECDLAVELAPGMAEAHSLRGQVLKQLGRSQEAASAYRQAAELDPYLLEPHHNLPRLETELRFGPEAAPREGKQFWIRAGAYLIDVVVFYGLHVLAMGATAFALGVLLSLAGHELRLYRGTCCMDYVVPGVLSVVYFAIFESLYGASLGKVLLRMRVIMISGERCTLGAALVRSLVRYVDGFLFGIPAYVIMQAPLYQRIGDKSANTVRLVTAASYSKGDGLYAAGSIQIVSSLTVAPP